jgi:plastocyanin
MRKALVAALVLTVAALLVVAAPASSKRKSVEVDDDYFVHARAPHSVSVKKNDTVVWEWEGSNPHNVTVTRGPVKFHSRTKTSGSYAKKLSRRGTYKILCTVHAPTMRMTLKVE